MHTNDSRAGIGARGGLSRGGNGPLHTCSVCSVLSQALLLLLLLVLPLPLRRRSLRSAFSRGGVSRGVHRAPSSSSPRERTRFDLLESSISRVLCLFLFGAASNKKARVSSPAFASLRAIISVLLIISGILVQVISVASRRLGQNCNSAV